LESKRVVPTAQGEVKKEKKEKKSIFLTKKLLRNWQKVWELISLKHLQRIV
jgi:hypothetical protein